MTHRMELEPQRQSQDSQRTIFQGAELCSNQVADDMCWADFTIAMVLLWAFCITLHPIHLWTQLQKPKIALQLSIEPDFKLTRFWPYSQCCKRWHFSGGIRVREGLECILHVEGSQLGKLWYVPFSKTIAALPFISHALFLYVLATCPPRSGVYSYSTSTPIEFRLAMCTFYVLAPAFVKLTVW